MRSASLFLKQTSAQAEEARTTYLVALLSTLRPNPRIGKLSCSHLGPWDKKRMRQAEENCVSQCAEYSSRRSDQGADCSDRLFPQPEMGQTHSTRQGYSSGDRKVRDYQARQMEGNTERGALPMVGQLKVVDKVAVGDAVLVLPESLASLGDSRWVCLGLPPCAGSHWL